MSSGDTHGPGRYEIRLKGHLHPRWTTWFDDLTVTNEDDGTTVLRGVVVDQSALHGLLHKVRDTGLPLVSVVRVPADESPVAPVDPTSHTTPPRKARP
ncbi:hypothetical protein GCM10022242_15220 [Nocardioides panacisoli]|uniref:BON domain-containing protein n=2 Tax=Nocardioides panacisoli TaxID=627624 RepID=A0ABP7IB10_9ACTN